MTKPNEYITKTGLKGKGWTDSLIKRFLPKSDKTECNPHYKCRRPMHLYLVKRVARVEKTPAFLAAREVAENRRAAAKSGTATKRQATEAYLQSLEIAVPELDDEELVERALSYNSLNWERGRYATPSDAPNFLDRICVNFLRHEMTGYEEHLEDVHGRVGAKDAYLAIKEKVLNRIADVYPRLFDECMRQIDRGAAEEQEWAA